jgi:hypothetical protein
VGGEPVPVLLDPGDLFRLSLLSLGDRHVHVYAAEGQALDAVARIFPAAGDPAEFLLPGYEGRFVPSASAWFLAEGAAMERRIVVVSAREPLPDLAVPGALRALRDGEDEGDLDLREFVLRNR